MVEKADNESTEWLELILKDLERHCRQKSYEETLEAIAQVRETLQKEISRKRTAKN